MSKIVKISENNYRLKVQAAGTITLDTGDEQGEVIITGDLKVLGTTTTIDTVNMTVEDNVILLNKGEQGAGVTEGTSGLEIDRGTLSNARWIFDETATWYDPLVLGPVGNEFSGVWTARFENEKLGAIRVANISNDGTTDLVFDLQDPTNIKSNVLNIVNISADHYAELLFGSQPLPDPVPATQTPQEDNNIVNKRFVSLYVASGVFTPGMADVDKIYKKVGAVEKSRVQAFDNSIDFLVNQTLKATITVNGLDVNNVNVFNNTVKNTTTNNNLILTTALNPATSEEVGGLKNVEIDGVLWLDDQVNHPLVANGTSKLFSVATSGSGRSGLYITKNSLNNIETWDPAASDYVSGRDELVVKNRALLFSMLF
jgi:hypothetical protein